MPKITKLSDVSASTMSETSTPILAVVARMAVTELEHRAGVAGETLASLARGHITQLAQQIIVPPRRHRKGGK